MKSNFTNLEKMRFGMLENFKRDRGISLVRIFLMFFMGWMIVGCERKEEIPTTVAVSEDGEMELNLMTFNVRYENGSERGKRSWKERVIGVVQLIKKEKPDVFGIQEGLVGQVADLRVSLGEYEFFGVGRDDAKKNGEFAGLFFRKDRFEWDEGKSGTIWLSDRPEEIGSKTWGNQIPRTATWVKLVDRASGQTLWVINVHMDHQNQPSREKGAKLIAERIVEMSKSGDAVVLIGDFNAVEFNPAIRFLKGDKKVLGELKGFGGMTETYDVLNAGVKERGTLHFWMSDRNRQWKVDHIFITRRGRVLKSAVLRGEEPYLSDHFPVTARVLFPAPGR